MAKKQTNGNLALEQQRVIVIPAHDEIVARKLRVAAYARVSSSSEDQLNSYRVQNQYYSSSSAIRIGKWSTSMPTRASLARRSKSAKTFVA